MSNWTPSMSDVPVFRSFLRTYCTVTDVYHLLSLLLSNYYIRYGTLVLILSGVVMFYSLALRTTAGKVLRQTGSSPNDKITSLEFAPETYQNYLPWVSSLWLLVFYVLNYIDHWASLQQMSFYGCNGPNIWAGMVYCN